MQARPRVIIEVKRLNIHEEPFIKAFVVRARQTRFLKFLANPKKRHKFIDEFNHLKPGLLAPEFTVLLSGSQSLTPNVLKILHRSAHRTYVG